MFGRGGRLPGIGLALVLALGSSGPVAAAHIRAVLEAETLHPAAGSRIMLALAMAPEPGWHGYWQNPGDAGAPTVVGWSLPRGVVAGSLQYPVPRRLMTQGLMNYVYDQPYALLLTLDVPKGLVAGTPLRIAGRARWLACSATLCVPEQGAVGVDLLVGDGAVTATAGKRFNAWRARLPVPFAPMAHYRIERGKISISIPFPRQQRLSNPYFYAATDRVIDYAAPQLITRQGDRVIVETAVAANAETVKWLDGVLVTGGNRGLSLKARPGGH